MKASNEDLAKYRYLQKSTDPNELEFWKKSISAERVESKVKLISNQKRNIVAVKQQNSKQSVYF